MLNDIEFFRGTEYHVDPRYFGDLTWLQLRITTHYHDVGTGRVTERFAHHLAAFPVGILCHRAGIDHINIRRGMEWCGRVARILEDAANGRRFRKIQLTSQGIKCDSFAHQTGKGTEKTRNSYRLAKFSVSSCSFASASAFLFRSL